MFWYWDTIVVTVNKKRQLLVGLEDRRSLSNSKASQIVSELTRLAAGEPHRFRIYTVASAGMKDGSITLPLIYKNQFEIYIGQRLRFYVREPIFAMKEIKALWLGYQQRRLNQQYYKEENVQDMTRNENDGANNVQSSSSSIFQPSACFIIPTLDRGNKFFQGQKSGYESSTASLALSNVPCITGFFSNGVVGSIMDFATVTSSKSDGNQQPTSRTGIQGSASGYFLFGSWSGRPVYNAVADAAAKATAIANKNTIHDDIDNEDERESNDTSQQRSVSTTAVAAPRYENGELVIKRREVNSGRALTVSTIEWSVAEKTARPSSTLEGFMWSKETEVDRLRERFPMAMLMSQCRASMNDPTSYKPRDWIGPIKQTIQTNKNEFVIIPECKKIDPSMSGSIRRRYDIPKLISDFVVAGVPALSVNCDSILFGGTVDHITAARKESNRAAIEALTLSSSSTSSSPLLEDGILVPPILASDLILYPYQLYKLQLAGADAINIIVGALEAKDIVYLTKIAASLQLQVLATVTSEVQVDTIVSSLPKLNLQGIIVSNRQLEDYSFDMSGEQALRILRSPAMKDLREKHGENNMIVLVEGRVGIIERKKSILSYIKELKEAGAMGAIVGGGLAPASTSLEMQQLMNSLRLST
jgi:indole-3-glycerol phosphate synthase